MGWSITVRQIHNFWNENNLLPTHTQSQWCDRTYGWRCLGWQYLRNNSHKSQRVTHSTSPFLHFGHVNYRCEKFKCLLWLSLVSINWRIVWYDALGLSLNRWDSNKLILVRKSELAYTQTLDHIKWILLQ